MSQGRLLVAFVAALAAAVIAPATASAERDPADGARGAAAQCADPCFAVGVSKVGTGTVTSNPAGIDCGAECTADFVNAPYVWLTATSSTGGWPVGWDVSGSAEGCAENVENSCLLIQKGAITGYCVVVLFEEGNADSCTPPPPPPPLSTNPPPAGSKCTIVGSPFADVIRGTARNDVICGRGGKDTIRGAGGHDRLVGGGGNDKLYGGPGNDALVGGRGNDLLDGGRGADSLLGGTGADAFYARDGVRDVVNGGVGRDRARVDRFDVRRSIERRF